MMFKRSLKVLIALGLTLGVCLVAGPSAAQEPPGKQLREAPSAPEADREPVAVLGQKTLYATADTYILEGYPAYNAGTETQMLAGYDEYYDPDGRIARSLVRFDLASLPPSRKITQATLRLFLASSWDYPEKTRTIVTYRIASDWAENSLTWNNEPSYGAAHGSRSILHSDWGWYEFDVTDLVRGWYNGTYPNYGIMVRGPEVSGDDSSWRGFYTREGDDPPQLVVKYSEGGTYLPVILNSGPRTVFSKVIRTSEEGIVQHPGGAEIYVPRGAVPESVTGGEGEMLFTIEQGQPKDFGLPSTPPSGWEFLGDVFSMGPEGFIFETPIVATIPLPPSFDRTQHEVTMFDYDWEDGEWVSVGGRVNEDGTSLSADVLHLCGNTAMARNVSGRGHGAIRFNAIPRYSFKICIETYTLKYPDWDNDFRVGNRFRNIVRRDTSTCPPDGFQYWRLPQGTYLVSVGVYVHEQEGVPPRYLGYFQRTITIDRPHWDWERDGPDYEFAVPFGSFEINPSNLIPGRPPCMGSSTPSVGVGSVNVRLEWRANADLDLWVVDPCGNKIYWNDKTAPCQGSTGWLDQDNWCQAFVLGKPENIYWAQYPPQGKYKVYVDYYEDCAGAGPVNYTLRWWVDGKAYVKRGTISPPASPGANGDEVLVTQFNR